MFTEHVPLAWTYNCQDKKKAEKAAGILSLQLIKAFQKEIWIPTCKRRKEWKKLNIKANEFNKEKLTQAYKSRQEIQ